MRGRFVVLEGIDGSGTTTQIGRLSNALRRQGFEVHETREPSDGSIGKFVRTLLTSDAPPPPDAMALLFAADRLAHVQEEIVPALRRGAVVLSDRYDASSLLYQSHTSPRGVADALPWVRSLNQHALRPDLTIVLDVSAEVAERRRAARGSAQEHYEQRELLLRLAEAYRSLETWLPHDAILHVDGHGDPETVFQAVFALVRPRLA